MSSVTTCADPGKKFHWGGGGTFAINLYFLEGVGKPPTHLPSPRSAYVPHVQVPAFL